MSCNASILSCISFAPQLSCPDINLFFSFIPLPLLYCLLHIPPDIRPTYRYSSHLSHSYHALLFTIFMPYTRTLHNSYTYCTTRSNHTTVLTLFTLLTVPTCSITFLWEFKVVLRSRPFLAAPAPGSSILAAPAPARLRLGLRLRGYKVIKKNSRNIFLN